VDIALASTYGLIAALQAALLLTGGLQVRILPEEPLPRSRRSCLLTRLRSRSVSLSLAASGCEPFLKNKNGQGTLAASCERVLQAMA
jgi:hypothetical protein